MITYVYFAAIAAVVYLLAAGACQGFFQRVFVSRPTVYALVWPITLPFVAGWYATRPRPEVEE